MSGQVAVLGAGSWGTAFAKILADAGRDVTVWARRRPVAEAIRLRRHNPDYLPDLRLPERVTATGDAAEAITGAELVVLAVPSQTLRANLAEWAGHLHPDSTLVSLMKGIELGTTRRMSEVIVETAGVTPSRVVVVSGPNLAPEIAAEQPAATVVAGTDDRRARLVQASIRTPYFRPYTNDDVIGCELGGAVKNVIALAYGIATAMGFGDNTRAMLMTRGLAETARLGVALGADPITFAGLAGMGDLVASCSSPLARNRTFGEHLGRGETLEQAQAATRQTAEGVKSCLAIRDLARAHGVEMPITEQIERICHEGMDPRLAVDALMSRTAKPESYE
ncbi:NAD(P)H-dependent glycerol-3-phosphate dehydrogenase [Micromonospora sp. NPDC048830]|uniref:NAD(P)H-dependent glycerol-3-phosphate dehydrogenase n=1 Tax=Micromonospora sp. NPDC048830 TaxID=3364257 RepID=UPI0037100700